MRARRVVVAVALAACATAAAREKGNPMLTLGKPVVLEQVQADLVAVHRDGRRWALALAGLVEVRDAAGKVVASDEGEPVQSLRFSADGRAVLASPGVIDLATGKARALPPALSKTLNRTMPGTELTGSAFTPDGKRMVVAARGRPRKGAGDGEAGATLLLLDGKTRALSRSLWAGDARLDCVATDGRSAAAADVDVVLAGIAPARAARVLEGDESKVRSLAFSPDGKTLAASDASGSVTLWEVKSGRRIARFAAHAGDTVVAFHPSLPVLVTGADGEVRLWSLGDAPARLSSASVPGEVRSLAFAPAGDRLLAATWSNDPVVLSIPVAHVP